MYTKTAERISAIRGFPYQIKFFFKPFTHLFFSESHLLRPHFDHILRNNHIAEADAPGVKRVVPFMLIAMEPTQKGDRDPTVDEYRVN